MKCNATFIGLRRLKKWSTGGSLEAPRRHTQNCGPRRNYYIINGFEFMSYDNSCVANDIVVWLATQTAGWPLRMSSTALEKIAQFFLT
jgi:hypothetical protein